MPAHNPLLESYRAQGVAGSYPRKTTHQSGLDYLFQERGDPYG